jgi:zinc transport system ATP-binding protein
MSQTAPDVEIRGVSFAYGTTPVLDDVNLTIQPRQAVCIVGPNGGGKTTLVKLIIGLLMPDRGEIRVFGQSPQRARLRIGYMPQHAQLDPQFPVNAMDVGLMGRLGGRGPAGWFGHFGAADRRAARDALAQVEMEPLARRPLAALSGGQRQRVLIARALCSQPDLLLLDEPTANVDSHIETQLVHILRRLNDRMTIVLVSHDLGFVSNLVETVVCVNRRVVVHPTREFNGSAIREIYGGDVRMVRHEDILPAEGRHE